MIASAPHGPGPFPPASNVGGGMVGRAPLNPLDYRPSVRALFVGPTLYARLSKRLWVIAAWSAQVAGRAVDVPGALDLTHFERYQAKVQFGLEF